MHCTIQPSPLCQPAIAMSQNGAPPHHVHRIKIFKPPMLAGTAFSSKIPSAPDMTKLTPRQSSFTTSKNSNGSALTPSTSSSRESQNGSKAAAQTYGMIIAKGGEGGTSRVFFSRHKSKSGQEKYFAIKSYNVNSKETEDRWKRHLQYEHEILIQLRHHNIVQVYDMLQDSKGSLFEVLEFCEGGDLMSMLSQRTLSMGEADCYFFQLMTGLEYLHDLGIVHRDLKGDNLVLSRNGTLKIADFGNAEQFKRDRNSEANLIEGKCGSTGFMAPELFTADEFAAAPTDIWSAGIIYVMMRFRIVMWNDAVMEDPGYAEYLVGRKSKDGYVHLEQLKYEKIGGKAWETDEAEMCRNTVYSILDPRPERRLSAADFLRTEWARSMKPCSVATAKGN